MVLTSFMLELFHFAVVSNVRSCFWYVIHSLFTSVLSGVYAKYKLNLLTATTKKAAWLNKSELDSASLGLQRQKFVTQVKLSKNQMPKRLRERCGILLYEVFSKNKEINSHAGQTIMQTVSHYCSITFCFSVLRSLHLALTADCHSHIYTLASSDITIAQGVYQYLQAENLFSTGVFPWDRKENLLGYI